MSRSLEKHSAFTLVEMLVTMLIMSVLAGIVMIVSISAADKATATKIVNDFKVIQKASVMCHVEKKIWWPGGTNNEEEKVSVLAREYTDSPNINEIKAYKIWGGSGTPGYGIFFIADLTKMKSTENLRRIFKMYANGGLGVQLYDKNYSTSDLTTLNSYTGKKKWSPYNGGDLVYFCISKSYY